MLRGVIRALLSAVVLASLAAGPVRADAFGGVRGGFKAKSGFQGFNPGGFQGFNPGGFQGFNPGGGFQGFNPGGFQGFNPGGFQGFNPGGFQGFNPPDVGRPLVPRFPKHGGSFRPGPWRGGYGYPIGAYGGSLYYVPAPGDSFAYDGPAYPYEYSNAVPYVVVSAPPPVYAPPPVPFSTSVGPTAPPRPNGVDYPGGRYELRGDGLSTPYVWVWIPDPPAAPPAGLPPGPGPDDRPPERRSRLYRWVDEQGVVHLTDNAETVPEQYRKQVTSNTPL